ncbi:MAG: TIGR02266 family protein [Nitrospirae bacterium]|nr:TIGR02266 family protein [Nitrospirota bacterium]
MPDDFDAFARQITAKKADETVFNRKVYRCPHCKEVLHESYIEQNPFPQIPCSSCGMLVSIDALQNVDLPSSEQRREKRCPLTLKVSYTTYGQFIDEYTKNVSRGGMFIRTKRPHQVKDVVELLLHVPGLPDPVHIKGEIAHVNIVNAPDEEAGVGVKFIDIDDTSRQALITFIKSQDSCS